MRLSEIFEALQSVELSTSSYVDMSTLTIKPEKYPSLVSIINRGLYELYNRFLLQKGTTTIYTTQNSHEYSLDCDDDIIEILHVIKDGHACSLDGSQGVYLLNPHTIKFIKPHEAVLEITYKAKHPTIEYSSGFNPEYIDVFLPTTYLNALVYFIASRIFTVSTTVMDGNTPQQVSYTKLFEDECFKLLNQGTDVDEDLPANLFHSKGFL